MKKMKAFVLILAVPFLIAACAHVRETDVGHYSKAEKYYAQGKFGKAIEEYGAYLTKEPDGNMAIIAHYYIAKSHLELGHVAEAKAGFQNVIDQYPQSDWAQFAADRLKELAKQK